MEHFVMRKKHGGYFVVECVLDSFCWYRLLTARLDGATDRHLFINEGDRNGM